MGGPTSLVGNIGPDITRAANRRLVDRHLSVASHLGVLIDCLYLLVSFVDVVVRAIQLQVARSVGNSVETYRGRWIFGIDSK